MALYRYSVRFRGFTTDACGHRVANHTVFTQYGREDFDLETAIAASMHSFAEDREHRTKAVPPMSDADFQAVICEVPLSACEGEACPICLEPMQKKCVALRVCGHKFCDPDVCDASGGIRRVLNLSSKPQCPCCRAAVDVPSNARIRRPTDEPMPFHHANSPIRVPSHDTNESIHTPPPSRRQSEPPPIRQHERPPTRHPRQSINMVTNPHINDRMAERTTSRATR